MGQPFVQHAVPPSQHCPLQPVPGPDAQWQAPETHVPPAQGMQAVPQTICPVGQAQFPPVHVAVDGQEVTQSPQCFGSVARLTQADPQTSGSAAGQWHALPAQISFASGQAFPQALQFAGSFVVFTHSVGVATGHCVGSEAGQAQVPEVQVSCTSGQAFPQTAQFAGSDCVSVQNVVQSSGFAPPQAHAPAWHVEPGFTTEQDVVHEPHAPASVCRFLQRGTRFAQNVSLPAQTQAPPEHVAPAPQATRHAPQLFGSVW